MKCRFLSIIALFLIFTAQTADYHFFDDSGNTLPEFENVYPVLKKYFPDTIPKKINVVYIDDKFSRFNVDTDSVRISKYKNKDGVPKTIAHELSHICLAKLTDRTSLNDSFRFFDEGFANIIGSIFANEDDKYQKYALSEAKDQLLKNNLSFDKVQNWNVYYDRDNKHNSFAYPVGSSFNYFIIDKYGMDKLFLFFKEIGKTSSLNKSLKKIFEKDKKTIEAEWIAYIKESADN